MVGVTLPDCVCDFNVKFGSRSPLQVLRRWEEIGLGPGGYGRQDDRRCQEISKQYVGVRFGVGARAIRTRNGDLEHSASGRQDLVC